MTRLDVIHRALRRLGIISKDESADASDAEDVGEVLDALFDELQNVHEMVFTWDLTTVPLAAFIPLANLLAVEIAVDYDIAPRETKLEAMARMRAYAFPSDFVDNRDLDEDGVISDEEAQSAREAAYY